MRDLWGVRLMGSLTPEQALQALIEGNRRHRDGQHANPRRDPAFRAALAAGQAPWAAILGCSDSRVPPEIIFDQGLGDLFVVRTAGHVCDAVALASLRYAVEHLGVRLLVVLGHTHCGAIKAALAHPERALEDPLCAALRSAMEEAKASAEDLELGAAKAHVRRTVNLLAQAFTGIPGLLIVGAVYDLTSGEVTFLQEGFKPAV